LHAQQYEADDFGDFHCSILLSVSNSRANSAMSITGHFCKPAIAVQGMGQGETADERVAELREFGKELTAQALAMLPFQAFLASALGASVLKEHFSGVSALASVILLGVSFASSAVALSRVQARPAWTAASSKDLVKQEVDALTQKGFALKVGAWSLFLTAVAVALTAITAIGK
jgi:hypothetical protein